MSAKDGGPAFPCEVLEREGSFGSKERVLKGGMTLRDWFAGQVAAAQVSNHDCMMNIAAESGAKPSESVAKYAYKIADAMLAERAK